MSPPIRDPLLGSGLGVDVAVSDGEADGDAVSDAVFVGSDELGVSDGEALVVGVGVGVAAALGAGVGVGEESAYATNGAPISPTTSAAAARPAHGRGDDDADMDGS